LEERVEGTRNGNADATRTGIAQEYVFLLKKTKEELKMLKK
jgi:hypothetical protein